MNDNKGLHSEPDSYKPTDAELDAIYKPAESVSPPAQDSITDESWELAKTFHETYERLAPSFGYKTRPESAKQWGEVPHTNKQLMAATCAAVLSDYTSLSEELSRARQELYDARNAGDGCGHTSKGIRGHAFIEDEPYKDCLVCQVLHFKAELSRVKLERDRYYELAGRPLVCNACGKRTPISFNQCQPCKDKRDKAESSLVAAREALKQIATLEHGWSHLAFGLATRALAAIDSGDTNED